MTSRADIPAHDARARCRTRRGAFTLLELMVSLTIGGLAISSIYAIGAVTSRQFHQQQGIANAQTSLRLALDQLKRDISRAGYLGTPWANAPGQSCGTVNAPLDDPANSGRLGAFSHFSDNVIINAANSGVDPTNKNAANGFTADDLVMFGNYSTSSEYPGVSRGANSNQIFISQSWQSFQHDFTDWYNSPSVGFDPAAFQSAFLLQRVIRITATNGLRHFAQVTAVQAPVAGETKPVGITFSPAVPGGCWDKIDGARVSPMNAIRYTVLNAAGGGDPVAQLVRMEVDPTDKTNVLAGTTPRSLLDFVVEFNLSFVLNGVTAVNQPDNYAPGVPTPLGAATVNVNTELIRAVVIDLAVRTPQQDPRLPWTQAGCANLRCFQVSDVAPGAARVRRARAEVFVPNVAFEGY